MVLRRVDEMQSVVFEIGDGYANALRRGCEVLEDERRERGVNMRTRFVKDNNGKKDECRKQKAP